MPGSKKNLLITLEWPPHYGGVGRMYFNLVAAVPREVCVWAPAGSAGLENLEMLEWPQLSDRGWPKWRLLLSNLVKLFKQRTFTKVIVGQIFPIGLPVYILSFWFGYKYDVFVHGLDVVSPLGSWRRKWLLKKILKRAHRVLAANKNIAEVVSGFVDKSKIQIVYPSPFVRPEKFATNRAAARTALGLDERPIILSVGRLVARKGHRYVLEAWPTVLQQYPDSNYVIVGDGPFADELRQIVKSRDLEESVKIIGAKSDKETAQWYAAADVFIQTPFATANDVEGLGVVYLEAASFGCPIVASRSGGIVEFVKDLDNGLLVREKNSEDIANSLLRLLSDPELRWRIATNGHKKVELFSAVEQAAKVFL